MTQTSRNSRQLLEAFVSILMLLPALLGTIRGYKYFSRLGPGSWQSTDWYISNDFGFVRRGLLGGPLHAVAKTYSSFNVNLLTFLLTIVAVWIVSFLIVKKSSEHHLLIRIAAASSPVFYPVYFLWDPQGGGRKEVLAMIFASIFLCVAKRKGVTMSAIKTFLVIVILPALTLAHEAIFLFFAPIFIFTSGVDWINSCHNWRDGMARLRHLVSSFMLLIPSFIAFLAAYFYSKLPIVQVQDICQSWREVYYSLSCVPLPAALEALAGTENWGVGSGSYFDFIAHSYKSPMIYLQWLLAGFYAVAFLSACCMPFIDSTAKLVSLNGRHSARAFLVALSLLVFTFNIPLYAFAIDYGRWMSVSLTMVLMTCALYREEIASAALSLQPLSLNLFFLLPIQFNVKATSIALIFLSGVLMVPHCCVRFWSINPLFGRLARMLF